MRRFPRLPLFAATLLAAPVAAQTPPLAIDPEAVRAHVEFLADDLLAGRDTGTPGYDIAANYVASRYRAAGLTPAADGGWFQPVTLQETRLRAADAGVTVATTRFAHGEAAIVAPGAGAQERVAAGAVFVGYGIDSPNDGFDDYRGLDVVGRIVVMLVGAPEGTPSELAAHLNADKARNASERGAIGIVQINTDAAERTRSFERSIAMTGDRPATAWVGGDGQPFSRAPGIRASALVDRPVAEALFANARTELAAILAQAARDDGRPRGFDLARSVTIEAPAERTRIVSNNVVGMIPGTDPALAQEYVLLMGHLDHIGTHAHGEDGADRINNGAMDNAAGIATMLEAARALAGSGERTRRPILFAAVTAEERGLVGADYLAQNLPVDGHVVAVVNLDMPILLYPLEDVIAFGAEHSTMGPMVAAATAEMGIRTSPDPLPEERLFTRSDHYRFVQQGVPSVFLMTGFAGEGEARFREFLTTHYHQPSDEIDLPFNWESGARFAEINLRIARAVANADQAPRWYADSVFGRTFAPDAPKAERSGD